jgi:F-type H+-transporting ATPase subunit b
MAEQAHTNAADSEHSGASPATGAEHTAGTEAQHAGAEHAVPQALGMDATMFVALAMLVVIALALWKKVPAMIGGMLDKKIEGIREQLDVATALRKEAEGIKAEYQAKSKQAAKDAVAMKAAAEAEAKDIVAKAKADATALIARRSAMAEQKIAAAEIAAVADVRARATAAATAAATALIAGRHDAKADKSIVDATISSLN